MDHDLSKVKVGDWIWTIRRGWEQVIKLNFQENYFLHTRTSLYTQAGFFLENDKYPSAFIEPPKEFNAKPKPCKFTKGQKVLVWNNFNSDMKRRYFSHESNNEIYCFVSGCDEWSSLNEGTVYWEHCKAWEED